MRLKLKNIRIAFPELFQAKINDTYPDQPPKFNLRALIDKDDPQIEVIKAAITEVAKAEFKDKAALTLKQLAAQDRLPLHDGDLKASLDGHEGMDYINLSSRTRPTVLNKNKTLATEANSPFYSGCRCDLIFEVSAYYNRQKQPCVSVELAGVMFVGDDTPLEGGGITTAKVDEFDTYEDSDDDFSI